MNPKIPQEIEEKILKDVFSLFKGKDLDNPKYFLEFIKQAISLAFEEGRKNEQRSDNHNWIDEKDCFISGFNKGFKAGQKQEREKVLKEFAEKLKKELSYELPADVNYLHHNKTIKSVIDEQLKKENSK